MCHFEDLWCKVKIETDFDTNIPSSFAFNTNQKILLYTKIAKISSKEKYDNVVNDIREIYGDTPVSLINLCKLSLIKNKLVHYNASKIILRKSINRIEFKDDTNLEKITSLVSNNLLLDTSNKKINLLINNISRANILDYLIDLL